ncbi:hypothetical protein [Nocardia thailandica]|uniref:hypothetical protein n=1 Tax=Nocardia thailandica TaxID=257275 RepID=UPI00030D15EE|nr:hypothetical protein [Nocardia thailandica]
MSYPNIEGLDLFGNLTDIVMSPWSGDKGLTSEKIAEIQNQYNTQRNTVRKNASDLGFDGDYHQPVVKGTDEFDRFDVATLRTKVDQINLDTVAALISAWKEISTRNTSSLDEFRKQIARGTSPDVWSGAAAAAAAATVSGYDETGKKVSTAAALTGNKLDELRTGLEPTKRLVPYAPEHRSGLDNLGSFVTGRGWRNDDVALANAKAEAVRVLNTVYAPVVHESDEKVPVIPIPKTVDDGGGPGTPGTPGTTPSPGTGSPNASTPGTTAPSTNPAGTTPASTENPGAGDTTTTDDATDTTTAGDTSTTPESTTPQSTTPAATTPSSPGSGSPAGYPSGTGSPGSGSPGTGTPGAGVPSAGGPGRSIAGGGSPTAANSAAASRATGSGAGAAGRSGMPGMMSPGAKGGGKDDESTKGIPDYLITQEHGDELTGLDNPSRTVPPVIGAD